jgi:hypothetical protein
VKLGSLHVRYHWTIAASGTWFHSWSLINPGGANEHGAKHKLIQAPYLLDILTCTSLPNAA